MCIYQIQIQHYSTQIYEDQSQQLLIIEPLPLSINSIMNNSKNQICNIYKSKDLNFYSIERTQINIQTTMQSNMTENVQTKIHEGTEVMQQHQQPTVEEDVTPETLQQFNRICLEATQLMNDYKNQSIALKQEIAGMVSIYQKTSSPTSAVPVQKIISITTQYQQGMKQANQQYNHLAQELKNEQHERDLIMLQIKDCFDKLERMEVKIKNKKLLQQQKDKVKQTTTQDAVVNAQTEGKTDYPIEKKESDSSQSNEETKNL